MAAKLLMIMTTIMMMMVKMMNMTTTTTTTTTRTTTTRQNDGKDENDEKKRTRKKTTQLPLSLVRLFFRSSLALSRFSHPFERMGTKVESTTRFNAQGQKDVERTMIGTAEKTTVGSTWNRRNFEKPDSAGQRFCSR